MIDRAAELGGAAHCLTKLAQGKDTMLAAMNEPDGFDNIQLSGGEKERTAASRTLMGFASGKAKFVVVDEPSSALDPEGEVLYFGYPSVWTPDEACGFYRVCFFLRSCDPWVIMAHRKAPSRRMKDGNIVEMENYKKLVEINEEHAKLYKMQTSAFV
ncbi:hypothetical protein EDD18DRAFT_1357565 [Armillaria luteobubalina]|uniref:ABC transporter domain-containing protein n=1 Tax=Armillaria luteobubalina TaxID=153913 RepID=A0AA39PYY0_9AGAR|nr:hypothetical protein EDD18DRAFT_1357565 [Armillaria luteobubalina]